MSVLSDQSLRAAINSLAEDRLRIEPFNDAAIQPNSYDLTLGPVLTIPSPGQYARLKTDELPQAYRSVSILHEPHALRPNEALLGTVDETITIPSDLVALIEGKSTIARLFVQVHAAGLLDSGYTGKPTLEITNDGPFTVYLDAGIAIAQLMVFRLTSHVERLYGSPALGSRYQGNVFPTPARAALAVQP